MSGKKSDYFVGSGTNDRIWKFFSKHSLNNPKSFLQYYVHPRLLTMSFVWLCNIVKPCAAAKIRSATTMSGSTIASCAQNSSGHHHKSRHSFSRCNRRWCTQSFQL
jgi:hypothetical protein